MIKCDTPDYNIGFSCAKYKETFRGFITGDPIYFRARFRARYRSQSILDPFGSLATLFSRSI